MTKRIKLDIDINELYDIININYINNNYDNCIKYYEYLKDNNYNIDNINIIIILSLCYIKLNKFENACDIFFGSNCKCNFADESVIISNKNINLYNFFDINNDSNFKNDNILIINYILGYCYKKLNNIYDAILYFTSCLNLAKNYILLNLIKNIHLNLIDLYISDKNTYFEELKDIYNLECMHKNYIELLITKNLHKDINDYIKNLLENEFIFMLDNIDDDIDFYLDSYTLFDESDVLFLLEKYKNNNKINKIKNLIDKIDKINQTDNKFSPEILIEVLYEYMNLNVDYRIKYCEIIFDLIEKLTNLTDKMNNIKNNVITTYNEELYYSNRLGNQKYKNYLSKKNLDIINNNYCKFLTLYKYFDINKIKSDNCVICYDKKNIIELNCHNTHKICYKCYPRIDKCPICRDVINS